MWFDLSGSEAGRPNDPAVIVAVSTSLPQYRELYSQARELGSFMLRKMESQKIATIHSSSLAPEVLVREDGSAALPGCYMHLVKGERDILLLTGDSSPMEDQYQFARIVLRHAEELGAKELYSVGARWAENPLSPEAEPQPNGFATDMIGVEKLRKCGVKVVQEEQAPFFASIIVGLAAEYGMRGYKLAVDHGEPSPHPRSVARILQALTALAGFDVSTDELLAQSPAQPQVRQLGDDSIYH
ncbi:MAG TPA: PAC2 family protein [Nitrososphaerales archaeon]|nr:PAC2 family protein [Nitrososphaerales archaeon]